MTEDGAGGAARPDHVHHLDEGPRATPTSWSRRSWSRWRSRRTIFRELDEIVAPEAILATNTSSLSVTEISTANTAPGRVIGVHFFNPAPVQNLVEIVRTVVTEPQVLARRQGAGPHARQEPGRLRRQGRLHRQHPALRLPQPRGLDVRGPLRHPRGHRRRDALRLRLPDGPAGAARPDRPRHGVRDPGDDVPAGPRPPARARRRSSSRWSPPACSAARPAAASTPTRAPDSPIVVADDADPVGRRQAAAAARHQAGRRRRHRHHGHRHRRGLRQGGVRRRCTSAAPTTRSTASRATIERSLDKAIQRGKLEESAKAEVLGRLTGSHLARRPRRRRHRGRGDRRGPQDQDHAVREPRRDLQAGRDPGHDDLVAADHRAARRPPSGPQDVDRHALLQPGADHEAGRGGLDRGHRRRRHRDHPGAVRQGRQGRRLVRRPGRLHRQRAAVPLPQRRGARCSRRTTPPPTTSTPR